MNKTILIVDDDYDIRSTVSAFLEDSGYHTKTAGNGVEALAQLRACTQDNLPCFVLLDLQMPVMTGETFLKVIEDESEALQRVPIVIFTARGSLSDFEHSKKVKMKLKKPIDIDVLSSIASQFCDGDGSENF